MFRMFQVLFVFAAILGLTCHSDNSTTPPPNGQTFRVQVGNEQFTMIVTDQQTIQLAIDNLNGKNTMHPSGSISPGDGGVNQPWKWHYIPQSVRMAEISIEVCDATPSYVNSHVNDFISIGYCPWTAKIIKVGS